MIITEKDIFTFVFSNENLENEKSKFIVKNILNYKKAIDFYKDFYSTLKEDDNNITNNLLTETFKSIQDQNVITLKPFLLDNNEREYKIRFAAASSMKEDSSDATTFINEENKLLVRVIKSNGKLKIYFNAAEDSRYRDAELKFLPSNLTFKITDDCLEIEGIPEITEIQIIN